MNSINFSTAVTSSHVLSISSDGNATARLLGNLGKIDLSGDWKKTVIWLEENRKMAAETYNSAINPIDGSAEEYTSQSTEVHQCVFIGNIAFSGSGNALFVTDGLVATNSIFHQNGGADEQALLHASFPNAPLRKISYCLVEGDYEGLGNLDADPMFVNANDPNGPDDEWFTEDDGLRLKAGSPAIDGGSNSYVQPDFTDLDKDGNTTESVPLDASGFVRFQGNAVDIGAHEYGDEYPTEWSLTKDLGDGWKRFEWFDSFYEHPSGWIYHIRLGWLYRVSAGTDSIWLYYPKHGWMWTNRTSYPYFYDSSTKAWMYFKSVDDKPRFYHYGTKAWVTLGE
jgi:hypothetical protein